MGSPLSRSSSPYSRLANVFSGQIGADVQERRRNEEILPLNPNRHPRTCSGDPWFRRKFGRLIAAAAAITRGDREAPRWIPGTSPGMTIHIIYKVSTVL